VPDRYRAAADVVGPPPPDRERILVELRDRTVLAPSARTSGGNASFTTGQVPSMKSTRVAGAALMNRSGTGAGAARKDHCQ
jgi:hypothetical protein